MGICTMYKLISTLQNLRLPNVDYNERIDWSNLLGNLFICQQKQQFIL